MIRKARLDDIEEILQIVSETIEDMRKEGNPQWNETYPTKEHFSKDINSGHLYIYEINKELAGFICINNIENKEYKNLVWSQNKQALVIHRFAVKRKYQRQKIGTKLMLFVEKYAREKSINYIKVDTNSTNIRMNALFKKLDYHFVGTIYMRNLDKEFNCYEKILM